MIVKWPNRIVAVGAALVCCFLAFIVFVAIADRPPRCDLKKPINVDVIKQTLMSSVRHYVPNAQLGGLSITNCTDNEELKIGSRKLSECLVGSLNYTVVNSTDERHGYGTMLFDKCGNKLFDVNCSALNC
jgi:hypothetical protein